MLVVVPTGFPVKSSNFCFTALDFSLIEDFRVNHRMNPLFMTLFFNELLCFVFCGKKMYLKLLNPVITPLRGIK